MSSMGGASAVSAPKETEKEPKIPKFSVDYMDKSVKPGKDFYSYAAGSWVKNNPVPADKARWGSFSELAERNNYLIHGILKSAAEDSSAAPRSPRKQVGDFFASAMNTDLLEKKKFDPIKGDLARIDQIKSTDDLVKLLADFHKEGTGGIFATSVDQDAKDSNIYAFQLYQGGLSLPDRDYYLKDSFA
ncbi:MAG: M13 family peptidase, partial [Cyanobacteria bacterium SZAS LIN-2]|nr:M13 family peptidase [Cyanobacteria bacterium SZAS LIN-2]